MEVKGTWTPNVTTEGNVFKLVIYVQGIWGVDEIHQVWSEDSIDVPQVTVAEPIKDLTSGKSNSFNIYPTPVKEKLNIEWTESLENSVNWKLISTSGIVVKEGTIHAGSVKQEIDTYQFTEGMYLLITEDPIQSKIERRKVLIIK